MIAFLTMIAPLMAMTYPLDKMHDGNAQGFNTWLKEYFFNLLIQPLHLILYTVLVGSAIEFASNNLIYAIVAVGFILQAEKILRKFFGFDKAGTLENGSTAALGGALAMAGVNSLKRLAGHRGGNNANKDKNKSEDASGGRKNKVAQRIRGYYGNGENGQNAQISNGQNQAYDYSNDQFYNQALPSGSANNVDGNVNQYGGTTNNLVQSGNQNAGDTANSTNYRAQVPSGEEANYPDYSNAGEIPDYSNYGSRDNNYDDYDIPYTGTEPEDYDYSAYATYATTLDNGAGAENANDIYTRDNPAINMPTASEFEAMYNNINAQDTEAIQPEEPQQIDISDANEERPSLGKRVWNGTKNRARGIARVTGKVARSEGTKKFVRTVGRGAMGVALGATAGVVGVAAGLASDEDKNILKYGGAAAGVGFLAGSTLAGSKGNSSFDELKQTYREGKLGIEGAKEKRIAEEEEKAKHDKERRRTYKDELNLRNKQEVDEAMKAASKFRAAGVPDDKIIIKAMQTKEFGDKLDDERKIILAGLATDVGKDSKKLKQHESRLREDKVPEKDIKAYVDAIRKINGIY